MGSEFKLKSLPGVVKVVIDRASASGLKEFSKIFWAPVIPEIQVAAFKEPKNKIEVKYLAPKYTDDWVHKAFKKIPELRRAYRDHGLEAGWIKSLKERDMMATFHKFVEYLVNEDDEGEISGQVVGQGNFATMGHGPIGVLAVNHFPSSIPGRKLNSKAAPKTSSQTHPNVNNAQAVKTSKRQAAVLQSKFPDLTLRQGASQGSSALAAAIACGAAAETTGSRLYQEPRMEENIADAITKARGSWMIFRPETMAYEILWNPQILKKSHVQALSIVQSNYPEILLVGEVFSSVAGGMFLLRPTEYFAQAHESSQAEHPELGQVKEGLMDSVAESVGSDPMDLDEEKFAGKLDPLLSTCDEMHLDSSA